MNKTIQYGQSGLAVLKLQETLNALQPLFPFLSIIKENGQFDNQTRQAIQLFQNATGLLANGTVDSLTWDKLYLKIKMNNLHFLKKTASSFQLVPGENGLEIQKLQSRLNYWFPNRSALKLDGFYGPLTESHVLLFQLKNNLNADGIIDTKTWDRLMAES